MKASEFVTLPDPVNPGQTIQIPAAYFVRPLSRHLSPLPLEPPFNPPSLLRLDRSVIILGKTNGND
jgi:hypothetical protein